MEEIKEETVLNLCKVKDKYMESFQGKVKEMFKEFESKEVESSLIDLIVELESLK
ncbi:hypothetical protein Bca4012_025742 [Brassica carinata]